MHVGEQPAGEGPDRQRLPHREAQRPVATEAEARALASAVRLRILRMCLDEAMTNAEIAARLGRAPGSVLHHVRTLVDTGFLQALPARRGVRGSRPVPYRATGRSWLMEADHSWGCAVLDALDQSAAGLVDDDLAVSRLGLRLGDAAREELLARLDEVLQDFAARAPDPAGRPWSLTVALHPDPDRD